MNKAFYRLFISLFTTIQEEHFMWHFTDFNESAEQYICELTLVEKPLKSLDTVIEKTF